MESRITICRYSSRVGWATELRMAGEQLRSGDDFLCDDCRKLGGLLLEERRESIEVGERIVRPIEVY